MTTYALELQDPNDGWRFIRNLTGETGTDAFLRLHDLEDLEHGEYRFRTDEEKPWEYVTVTEDGAEVFTE